MKRNSQLSELKREIKCNLFDHQKFRDAWSRMDEDLGDDEDHLDLKLVDEEKYLDQYKKLMNIQ